MAYNKVPKGWTEEACDEAIEKTLNEAMRRYKNEKFEQSSHCFLEIARIIRSIPDVRRKTRVKEHLERKAQKELKKAGIVNEKIAKEIIEKERSTEKMKDKILNFTKNSQKNVG